MTEGRMRIWVRGPRPTIGDAAALMNLWDVGNRRARLPRQREGDKHVRPFEEMMTGFRQLGYTGWNDDGVTTPDWYIPLTHDLYDADIRERLMHRITGRPN